MTDFISEGRTFTISVLASSDPWNALDQWWRGEVLESMRRRLPKVTDEMTPGVVWQAIISFRPGEFGISKSDGYVCAAAATPQDAVADALRKLAKAIDDR